MANTRGVFTLQEVRYSIEDEAWVTPDEAFYNNVTSSPNVGYYAGGIPLPSKSSTEKLNYGTDTTTAVPSANLTVSRYNAGAVSTVNNGYIMGGAPSLSSADKLSYVTETYSGTIPLPYARQYACGTGNDNAGYLGGGDGAATVSIVDKMIFAVDASFSLPSASLSAARTYLSSSSSPSAGYYGGGFPGFLSRMDKLTFSTETTAYIPAGNLSKNIYGMVATGNSTASYWGGGYTGAYQSGVDKLTYSTDTTAALPASSNLSLEKQQRGSLSAATAGYYSGGTPGNITTTDKFTFSNETASAIPSAATTTPLHAMTGVSPRSITGYSLPLSGFVASTQNLKNIPFSNFGYYQGGYTPFSYTQKIDYTTESNGLLPSANNTQGNIDAHSGSSSNTAAYFGLGSAPGGVSTIVNKLTYLTEAMVAVPGASFPTPGRYDPAAVTSFTNGYFGGGFSPGPTIHSKIEKLNYASETSSSMPATKLVTGRYHLGSAGNTTQGYFVQGITPSDYSNIEKLIYSTDTISQAISAATNIRSYIAGTSTESAGYFGGGSGNTGTVSFISKLSFSVDTWSQTPANLNTARYNVESVGNTKINGYFMGGWQYVTTTERISYASETVAAVPSGSLISGTNDGATASLLDYGRPYAKAPTPTLDVSYTQITTPFTGYTAGGGGPAGGRTSNYYKLLYATETGSFLPSTNLTSARSNYLGGYSDTTKGYTAGGYFGSPFFVAESWVDRVTYSTDTSVTVPGAYLPSPGRYGGTSGSSPSAGYYVAGFNTGALSTTLKMPFSSETHSTLPSSANLSSARYYFCGGGGPDKGYFGGGYPTTTKMDKLIYSTDTMTASPSTNLFGASDSTTRGAGAIVGNSRDAYLATGQNPGSPAPVPNYGYKINYSTDTSIIINGFVARPRQSVAGAFGHELQGYFCGGIVPSPYEAVTTVDKITYATEVSQLVPSASMPDHRSSGSNMSARNFGASGGGTSNIL